MRASIVIRTLNEAEHLDDLLEMIARQRTAGLEIETVLIDSGSTDRTVRIASRYEAHRSITPTNMNLSQHGTLIRPDAHLDDQSIQLNFQHV